MNNNPKPSKHPLLILFILFLIFIIPIILAWVFYSKHETFGEGTVNYGQLIQPPKDFNKLINTEQFKGKWLMLYVNPHRCDKKCEKTLYNMRQIRLATGKNMERVQRAVMTFSHSQTDYAGTVHLVVPREHFRSVMSGLPTTKLALNQGYLYLVDPLGNIMMGYSLDANPSNIFKDLQRLLGVSQIG